MSVRRFIGYFVALSACATIAFASFAVDSGDEPNSNEPDTLVTRFSLPLIPRFPAHMHLHKNGIKHIQLAQAE